MMDVTKIESSLLPLSIVLTTENSSLEELQALARYCRKEGLETFVSCDANAHNKVWVSTNTNEL